MAMATAMTLLLVEDDVLIAEVLAEALGDAGFAVVHAANGTEGLCKLSADQPPFDVVITDIQLGLGPNGWEIGRQARVQVAEMPVIYISADSAHAWPVQGVPNSIMIQKPFRQGHIINAVLALQAARVPGMRAF
jgi:DNA-binding response OmpR family regulator